MVLNNIEQLIEKYNNAETTLQEESQLRAYFMSDNVAPHLEHYKPLFVFFAQSQQELYTKDIPLKPKKNITLYKWISVAAIAVLMLGIVTPKLFGPSEEEIQQQREAELAYQQTLEAFKLISIGMNKGKSSMQSLALVSNNLDQGVESLSKLGEFSKSTNLIFKNN